MFRGIDSSAARGLEQFLISCSVVALAAATPAWADCTPKPTTAFGTVTCTGNEAVGLVVDTDQTIVTVSIGATVSNSGSSGIVVTSGTPNAAPNGNTSTIIINGTVTGGTESGILVTNGIPVPGQPFNYGTTRSSVQVAATGRLTGPIAIDVVSANYPYGFAVVDLTNDGII